MKEFKISESAVFERDLNIDIDIDFIEFSWDEPRHTHDGIEIVYIMDGVAEHIINGNKVRMKKGSFLIMDNDCVHSFENIEPTKYYNILLKPCVLSCDLNNNLKSLFSFYGEEINDKFIHIDFKREDADKIESLFFDVLKEVRKKEKGYANFIKIHMAEVINIVIRKYSERTVTYDWIESKFSEALEYIKYNCCGELELKSISEKFGYNPSYFSHILKKYFGLSFKQLVIKKRLEKALYMLWKEDSPIADIANECGFSNKSYFYEVFEKQFGVKPKYAREYWDNYNRVIDEKIANGKM